MTESKKGQNFAIHGPTEKKMCVRFFFVLMLHIKFQVSRSSGSLVLQPTTGVTDRRTDRRTGPNQYAPSTSSKLYRALWKKKYKKKKEEEKGRWICK